MINWRCIKDVGLPTDGNKSYLVTDGKDLSTTNISGTRWTGDENTWDDNSCCSGEKMFEMDSAVTHWCPTDEVELPK